MLWCTSHQETTYAFAPFPKTKYGFSSAILRIVLAKSELAHANHDRVYLLISSTLTDSCTRPSRLELRTRLMHSVISESDFVVMACTSRDMGQAFSRPTVPLLARV